MAESNGLASTPEQTFRAYTDEQGDAYAAGRPGYHPNLFSTIVDHHVSTGGEVGLVVDVGCGPGTATESIAPFFRNAIGLDPSEGMIATAKTRSAKSGSGQFVRFEVSSAEDMHGSSSSNIITDGTVDLITAATAAHWFDMPKFWRRAVQLLRPGGTVAIWTHNSHLLHSSVPNADRINAALEAIKDHELGPYMAPGNAIADKLYRDITLPWTITPDPISNFDESSFIRRYWGTLSSDVAKPEGQEFFEASQPSFNLDLLEKALNTASPVSRWRDANPEKVGTDKDVVKVMRAVAKQYLQEAGVPDGQEILKSHVSGVLLLIKRK